MWVLEITLGATRTQGVPPNENIRHTWNLGTRILNPSNPGLRKSSRFSFPQPGASNTTCTFSQSPHCELALPCSQHCERLSESLRLCNVTYILPCSPHCEYVIILNITMHTSLQVASMYHHLCLRCDTPLTHKVASYMKCLNVIETKINKHQQRQLPNLQLLVHTIRIFQSAVETQISSNTNNTIICKSKFTVWINTQYTQTLQLNLLL